MSTISIITSPGVFQGLPKEPRRGRRRAAWTPWLLLAPVFSPALRAQETITQQAYLKPNAVRAGGLSGGAVAISGDTAVVGTSSNGGVSVFVREGTSWTFQTRLTAVVSGPGYYGADVAISGDTIVVGARGESSNATGVNGNPNNNSAIESGAAYVFVRQGTSWVQQAYLKASNSRAGISFGDCVISGDTIVVGAQLESSDARGVNGDQNNTRAQFSGAAYVFVRQGATWTQQAYLKASNAEANDFFGSEVAISGDTIVVGAGGEASSATGVNGDQNNNSAPGSGAAYVFVREGTIWTQQAYLKPSNSGGFFGYSGTVAASGDLIAVGAAYEGSSTTGVNGDPHNNGASNSGAVYVFTRAGTSWSHQAYLKASNTGAEDQFCRVALSGRLLVAGAAREASNATGIDGNQLNNGAGNAGAAYIFEQDGTNWRQRAYLKASNTGAGDEFGYAVALSGSTLLVGAPGEDSNATGVNGNQNNNSATNSGAAYVFTIPETPPALSVAPSAGGIRVSWPLSAIEWRLEQSETLGNATWTLIPAPYPSDTTGFFHDMIPPASRGFFRLRKP